MKGVALAVLLAAAAILFLIVGCGNSPTEPDKDDCQPGEVIGLIVNPNGSSTPIHCPVRT